MLSSIWNRLRGIRGMIYLHKCDLPTCDPHLGGGGGIGGLTPIWGETPLCMKKTVVIFKNRFETIF